MLTDEGSSWQLHTKLSEEVLILASVQQGIRVEAQVTENEQGHGCVF